MHEGFGVGIDFFATPILVISNATSICHPGRYRESPSSRLPCKPSVIPVAMQTGIHSAPQQIDNSVIPVSLDKDHPIQGLILQSALFSSAYAIFLVVFHEQLRR